MAFCPNCGAQVAGSFCGSCGTRAGGPAQGAAPGPPPPRPDTPNPAPQPSYGSTAGADIPDNMAAALCYALGLITGIVFLVLEPYNRKREIRFHAFQSIFLNVAVVTVCVALSVLGAAIGILIPFGHVMAAMAWMVIWIGSAILWIVLLVKTYGGSKVVLPIIGPLAEKQAG